MYLLALVIKNAFLGVIGFETRINIMKVYRKKLGYEKYSRFMVFMLHEIHQKLDGNIIQS